MTDEGQGGGSLKPLGMDTPELLPGGVSGVVIGRLPDGFDAATPAICANCGKEIALGSFCWGVRGRGCFHADCYEAAPDADDSGLARCLNCGASKPGAAAACFACGSRI